MKKNNLKNTLKKVAALSLMLGTLINFGKVSHDLASTSLQIQVCDLSNKLGN